MNCLRKIDEDDEYLSKYRIDNNPTILNDVGKNEETNAIFVSHDSSKTKMRCSSILFETLSSEFQNHLLHQEKINILEKSPENIKEEQYKSKDMRNEIIIKEEPIEIIYNESTKLDQKSKKIKENLSSLCQKVVYKYKKK